MTIIVIMKRVAVSQLKACLSEYLSGVKAGEEVLVTDRGIPVARLIPLNASHGNGSEDSLQELAKAGLIRLPEEKSKKLPELIKKKNVKASVVDLLLKERKEGR